MTETLPARTAGPSGIEVSELALGSWNTWNRSSFDEVVETLRIALDAGVTLFDVGIYGDHLLSPREDSTDMVFARAMASLGVRPASYRWSAKGWLPDRRREVAPLRVQLEALLLRQGADHADFLVLGDLMAPTQDYSSVLEPVGELIAEGKALAWCVNNWSAAEVAEITRQAVAAGVPSPDFAQHKYGLVRRSVAEGAPFRALHASQGLTIQASDAFEGGLIFSDGGSHRLIGGDIGGIQERIRASRERIAEAARSLGATTAQLAVAVPLLNPQTSNVLIGARTPHQVRDALGAFDLLERHGRDEILAVADEFWLDRDAVAPDASWGAVRDDDPTGYVVVEK